MRVESTLQGGDEYGQRNIKSVFKPFTLAHAVGRIIQLSGCSDDYRDYTENGNIVKWN